MLTLCAIVVLLVMRYTRSEDLAGLEQAGKEEGVGGGEAIQMLRRSRHLQIIAVVIAMTSIGAGLIDQQLSMATEAAKGSEGTDAMTAVLANVQVSTSIIGFVIQVWLTSRIHRFLGIGFALMILPFGVGATGILILLTAQLWAPMFARVFDKSIRYTVDKTTREILFLPLPRGHQGQGQAIRGRDGGPRGPCGQCAHPARVDQALGAESLVAANQLREPGGRGGLGRAGAPGQARLHGRVPAQPGDAGRAAAGTPPSRAGPVHDRNARGGARPPRCPPRAARDRSPRGLRQAAPDLAAAAAPRVTGGPGTRTAQRRRGGSGPAGALGASASSRC